MNLTRAERFKDARVVHNQHGKQTMDEVAIKTGISKSMIQVLEDDSIKRSVGYDKVVTLARHYGVTTDYLLELTNDPAPQRCAVDDLGLSPAVVGKIQHYKEHSYSDCDTIGKLNHLFENDNIWKLLLLMHEYYTAVQAEDICTSVISRGICSCSEISKTITELANQYRATDIDLYDFLCAKAVSNTEFPVRVGLEESPLTDLVYTRILRQLTRILSLMEDELHVNG